VATRRRGSTTQSRRDGFGGTGFDGRRSPNRLTGGYADIVGELVVVTERLKVGGQDDLADMLRDTGES
jgi:hypothetical protein